ncbi:hypothetical protein [Priestia megaterium]
MGIRISYPVEVTIKAVELRLVGMTIKEVLSQLNISNHTQLKR